MKKLSILLFFLLAPLGGIVLGFAQQPADLLSVERARLLMPMEAIEQQVVGLEQQMVDFQQGIGFIQDVVAEQQRQYAEQQKLLRELAEKSQAQQHLSEEIYEQRIIERLGTPFEIFRSDQVELMLFEIKAESYRGYAAKVKLFDPQAIQVALAEDTFGKKETTSAALKRTGAIFAVNGGGFYETVYQGERIYWSLGNTVIRGDLVNTFTPSQDDVFFSGWTRRGELVGGLYDREEELLEDKPWYGVSFVPMLLKESQPLAIPEQWQRDLHPRTIMGQYANGDFLFMVIDGRQRGWSNGISLEEMQIKLLQLGVAEAYNLDGGGSSTFVYDGKVLNRPSDGRERPVTTNIIVMP